MTLDDSDVGGPLNHILRNTVLDKYILYNEGKQIHSCVTVRWRVGKEMWRKKNDAAKDCLHIHATCAVTITPEM